MLAQSIGEYGGAGGGIAGAFVQVITSAQRWITDSLAHDTREWVIGVVVLLIVLWLLRR